MKMNRAAVIAICADAWGVTPSQFRRMMVRREVMIGDVMARVRLEIYRNPLTAKLILNWIFQGLSKAQRHEEHQKAMLESLRRVAKEHGLEKKA